MRYCLVALCAVAVVAGPLPVEDEVVGLGGLEVLSNENEHYGGGGGIINLRRSDETSILGDVGDGTGVENAKRSSIGDLIDDASDVSSAEEDFIKDLFKRGEEGGSSSSLIGDIGVGLVALGDGDATGVKNAKRASILGGVGVGAVVLGDGEVTPLM
ncbi:uncharacterized protein N7459_003857 [Penicillium hispanicum]|uniref:uncharacterized protein n=1 Tax=Penicillium hispanicum TaxID=1080232 RepID=UPI0025416B4A|nr:uncharacterized protein N7459_003857 [Penicillium hispanicum]KAJ5584057.1 hypothetical protein N7459_003857 [Penicillium hispanicum]